MKTARMYAMIAVKKSKKLSSKTKNGDIMVLLTIKELPILTEFISEKLMTEIFLKMLKI